VKQDAGGLREGNRVFLRRTVSCVGLFCHGSQDHRIDGWRKAWRVEAWGKRVFVNDFVQQFRHAFRDEGHAPRDHFVSHRRECKLIRSVVCLGGADGLLRRHVVRRAQHIEFAGYLGCCRCALANTEIEQFHKDLLIFDGN
jgi:hypothetical protein